MHGPSVLEVGVGVLVLSRRRVEQAVVFPLRLDGTRQGLRSLLPRPVVRGAAGGQRHAHARRRRRRPPPPRVVAWQSPRAALTREDEEQDPAALPNDLYKKYVIKLQLSDYDASNLTDSKGIALYFEELIAHTKNFKAAANWMMGSVKSYLNQNALEIEDFSIAPEKIAQLIQLIEEEKVNNSVAT